MDIKLNEQVVVSGFMQVLSADLNGLSFHPLTFGQSSLFPNHGASSSNTPSNSKVLPHFDSFSLHILFLHLCGLFYGHPFSITSHKLLSFT